jgi:hypothetical protein
MKKNEQLMFAISNSLSKSEAISFAQTMNGAGISGILRAFIRILKHVTLKIENDG